MMYADDEIDSLFGNTSVNHTNQQPAKQTITKKTINVNNSQHSRQPSTNQAKALALLSSDDKSVQLINHNKRSNSVNDTYHKSINSDTKPLIESSIITSVQPPPQRAPIDWGNILGQSADVAVNDKTATNVVITAPGTSSSITLPSRSNSNIGQQPVISTSVPTASVPADVWSTLDDPLNNTDNEISLSIPTSNVRPTTAPVTVPTNAPTRQRRSLNSRSTDNNNSIPSILPSKLTEHVIQSNKLSVSPKPAQLSIPAQPSTPERVWTTTSAQPNTATIPLITIPSNVTEQLNLNVQHQELQRIRTELQLTSVQHQHMEARFRDTIQSMQQRIDSMTSNYDSELSAALHKQSDYHTKQIQHIQQLHQQQLSHLTSQHQHDMKHQATQYDRLIDSLKQQLSDASVMKSLVAQFDQSRQSLDVLQNKINTDRSHTDQQTFDQLSARAALLNDTEQRLSEQIKQFQQVNHTFDSLKQEHNNDKQALKNDQIRLYQQIDDFKLEQQLMRQQLQADQDTLKHDRTILNNQQTEWRQQQAAEQQDIQKQHRELQDQYNTNQELIQQLNTDRTQFSQYITTQQSIIEQQQQELAQRVMIIEQNDNQLQHDIQQHQIQSSQLQQRVQHMNAMLKRIESKSEQLQLTADKIERDKQQALRAQSDVRQLYQQIQSNKQHMLLERNELDDLRNELQSQYQQLQTQQQVCQQEIRLISTVKSNQIQPRQPYNTTQLQQSSYRTQQFTAAHPLFNPSRTSIISMNDTMSFDGIPTTTHTQVLQQLQSNAHEIRQWMQLQNIVSTTVDHNINNSATTPASSFTTITNNDSGIELVRFNSNKHTADISSLNTLRDISEDLSVQVAG